jgi:hypothetical protein
VFEVLLVYVNVLEYREIHNAPIIEVPRRRSFIWDRKIDGAWDRPSDSTRNSNDPTLVSKLVLWTPPSAIRTWFHPDRESIAKKNQIPVTDPIHHRFVEMGNCT